MLKFLALFAFVAAASAVEFRSCGAGIHVPTWVESGECTATRCTLTRGQTWRGRAGFSPLQTHQRMGVGVRAFFLFVWVDIDIPPGYEDGCDFLDGGHSCPLSAGNEYVWDIWAPVDSGYPAVSNVILELRATDVDGTIVACAQVDADIA